MDQPPVNQRHGITTPEHQPWWQTAVVYQIYPRSFAASRHRDRGTTSPVVGDLAGIREHLDHIQWLGADTLWLSPMFRSPMADFGYDISDFCDVDPLFGDLADLDALVEDVHARGMRILLDWVPNHTSIEHPWFQESRRDRTNPKAAWYIWRDEPVNNWNAAFPKGDPCWQFDEVRGQHYLRSFCVEQADLDWDVPEVEAAMLDTLRFWLDRGIDGFRMDVVHMIGKDLTRDDPAKAVASRLSHVPFNDVEVTHARLRRIRGVLDAYPGERVSVGEVYLLDEAAMSRYYGAGDELHLSFNFRFLWATPAAAELRDRITTTLGHLAPLGAWPTWVLSNHDVPRHRQRHGGDEGLARAMAVLLLTLPGTPFLYQGEELGLVDAEIADADQLDPGLRDGCRAPIPWTADATHGWPGAPWLPFPPESEVRDVDSQRNDGASILHLYHRLTELRRRVPGLRDGSLRWRDDLIGGREHVLAYERGDGVVVALNLGDHDVSWPTEAEGWTDLLSTRPAGRADGVLPGATGIIGTHRE
jgi:alpha-glucosidase